MNALRLAFALLLCLAACSSDASPSDSRTNADLGREDAGGTRDAELEPEPEFDPNELYREPFSYELRLQECGALGSLGGFPRYQAPAFIFDGAVSRLTGPPSLIECIDACVLDGAPCESAVEWVCRNDGFVADCVQDCTESVFCDNGDGPYDVHRFYCDGVAQCPDGSDEAQCPTVACGDGSDVLVWLLCDGTQDCPNGSDETGCEAIRIHECENSDQPVTADQYCINDRFCYPLNDPRSCVNFDC